jgi:GT2 family glycosyltransferase
VFLDCEGGRPVWLDNTLALTAGFRDCGETVCELEGTLFGLNMILRAEVFRKIGGFAPRLGPGKVGLSEDTEISLRMRQAGMRLIYAPKVIVYHRMPRSRLTRAFLRKRFFQEGRAAAFRTAPPVSLPRFGLYVVKESVTREVRAIRHRRTRRPAMALREECEAFRQAGFFWQHLRLRFGIQSHLSATDTVPAR